MSRLVVVLLPVAFAGLPFAAQAEQDGTVIYDEEDDEGYDDEGYDDEEDEDGGGETEEDGGETEEDGEETEEDEAGGGTFADDFTEEEGGGTTLGRLSPRWFWVTLSLGVAFGAGSAVTGGYTLIINRDYLEERDDPLLRQRGVELQMATNVLLGVTGALTIAAVVLGVLTDWSTLRPSADEEVFSTEDEAALSEGLLAQRLGRLFGGEGALSR